jgi:hypothetical protein
VSVSVEQATLPVGDDDFVEYGDFEMLAAPIAGRLSGFDPAEDKI